MTERALEAEHLRKAFGGVRAVDDVGFSLGAGEVLALIGPNGAGKTTLFNMLGGQIRPDAGRVLLFGRDITGLPPRRVWRLGVGRTYQVTATFRSMTVRQNVQSALLSHHGRAWSPWPRADRLYRDEAESLLAMVGMTDQAERAAGVLAYGDLKRLDLAIALAHGPRVLLMDEPTAGMAPGERTHLMDLTARVSRARGVAVLFTEHDMDVVFGHADRVLVLDGGRLVASGAPAEVRADARVRALYLGESSGEPEP
ncbi:ABC transporter ATP-binding protein [uncultured Rhodospira sp.]|uniref:ABC transporter ATP-binding protein n=1 Tax=uncultured Rhodospira sp. TaxID=1936189 RepID=UPI002626DE83|nr:ABC transporter ATP-binding protein [uncultured Rhodospira sp.]